MFEHLSACISVCYEDLKVYLIFVIKYFELSVESYRSLEKNTQGQSEGFVALSKWRILNRLHDRNETLYYRVSPGSGC